MKLIENVYRFMKSFQRSRLCFGHKASEEFSFFPLEVLQTAGERTLSKLIPGQSSCCFRAQGSFKQSLCLQR